MRKRTLTISVLNVVLEKPHTPEHYIAAFKKISESNKDIKLRGDWVGSIGRISIEEDYIKGYFYKFIDLQETRDWFNTEKREPADPEELEKINIPEYLKPHFQSLPFIFKIDGHKLFLITKNGKESISINHAKIILSGLFNLIEEKSYITPEPEQEKLEEILSMPKLKKLVIEITPPNSDDFAEYEAQILERLTSQNAEKLEETYTSRDSNGLRPDENTVKIANIAKSNGKVTGYGGERGHTKKLSTSDHPIEEKVSFYPEEESIWDILHKVALKLYNTLKSGGAK